MYRKSKRRARAIWRPRSPSRHNPHLATEINKIVRDFVSETRERHNSSQATEDSRMGSRHDGTITTFVDYDEVDIVLKDGENS